MSQSDPVTNQEGYIPLDNTQPEQPGFRFTRPEQPGAPRPEQPGFRFTRPGPLEEVPRPEPLGLFHFPQEFPTLAEGQKSFLFGNPFQYQKDDNQVNDYHQSRSRPPVRQNPYRRDRSRSPGRNRPRSPPRYSRSNQHFRYEEQMKRQEDKKKMDLLMERYHQMSHLIINLDFQINQLIDEGLEINPSLFASRLKGYRITSSKKANHRKRYIQINCRTRTWGMGDNNTRI